MVIKKKEPKPRQPRRRTQPSHGTAHTFRIRSGPKGRLACAFCPCACLAHWVRARDRRAERGERLRSALSRLALNCHTRRRAGSRAGPAQPHDPRVSSEESLAFTRPCLLDLSLKMLSTTGRAGAVRGHGTSRTTHRRPIPEHITHSKQTRRLSLLAARPGLALCTPSPVHLSCLPYLSRMFLSSQLQRRAVAPGPTDPADDRGTRPPLATHSTRSRRSPLLAAPVRPRRCWAVASRRGLGRRARDAAAPAVRWGDRPGQ